MTRWNRLLHPARAMWITLRRMRSSPQRRPQLLPFRGLPIVRTGEDGRPLCNACGVCAELCPTRCIRVNSCGDEAATDIDWQRCIACGICASECPIHAIKLDTGTVCWIRAPSAAQHASRTQRPDRQEGRPE